MERPPVIEEPGVLSPADPAVPGAIEKPEPPGVTVRSRPTGVLSTAFVLLFLAAVSLIPLVYAAPPGVGGRLVPVALGLLLASVACFVVYGLTWIEARPDELAWRDLLGVTRVPWEQVRDYYLDIGRKAEQDALTPPRGMHVVETRSETLRFDRKSWSHVPALKEAIRTRATRAQVRDWWLIGSRDMDAWPRTFRYVRPSKTDTLLPAGVMLALGLPLGFSQWLRLRGGDPGAGWNLALLLLSGLPGLAVFVAAYVTGTRAARQREDERIVADPAGLAWMTRREWHYLRWEHVVDYYVEPLRGPGAGYANHVVIGPEETLRFGPSVQGFRLLREIIQRYAEESVSREWRLQSLSGEPCPPGPPGERAPGE